MIASQTYRLFCTHMYLSLFLKCLYRACGSFHFTVSTLPRLSFKLQNSPGGGLELGCWKGLSFMSIHGCGVIVYLSPGFHIQEIHVRLRFSLAEEAPSGPGNLGKDWTSLSSEDLQALQVTLSVETIPNAWCQFRDVYNKVHFSNNVVLLLLIPSYSNVNCLMATKLANPHKKNT